MTNRVDHATSSFLVACVLAMANSAARGDDPPVTREAECRWAERAPTIDGKLDEPAWKAAAVIDRFPSFWKKSDPGPAHATKARLLWDRDALYFAAEMTDPDVRSSGTKHNDRLWDGDVFELFVKPGPDRPEYFEFQVNPRSVLFEASFLARNRPIEPGRLLGMSAVAVIKGTLDRPGDVDEGWTVEGRIPWSAFAPTFSRPEPGSSWSFALCRYDYFGPEKAEPVLVSSAPLTRPSFHRFEDYGRLRFQGEPSR
jgi:Carbohydrate family 9 binding domain-like